MSTSHHKNDLSKTADEAYPETLQPLVKPRSKWRLSKKNHFVGGLFMVAKFFEEKT